MKQFFLGAIMALTAFSVVNAAAVNIAAFLEYNNKVFKKSVSIKASGNTIDSNVYLEIGVASATKGAIRLYMTDSATIVAHKKIGVFYLNSVDTALWYYNGNKCKKVGS